MVRTGAETLVGVGIVLAVAVVLAVLGRRIRNGEFHLVAGYSSGAVDDDAGFARLVGTTMLVLAGVTAGYAAGMLLVEPDLLYWGSYVLLLSLAVGGVQLRGHRDE